jgi:putative ABC transport system substrate-binding protein
VTNRRRLLQALAVAFAPAIVPLASLAQSSGSKPRIGFLTSGPGTGQRAFWKGMSDLGYVEGKTMVVERRSAEGDLARLPALAAELVKWRPDVIAAFLTPAALAAKGTTATIPIVMVFVSDPVAAGLVGNSRARAAT